MSHELIYLTKRISAQVIGQCLLLPLSAKERTQLRGKRSTLDGTDVMLNLPRGGGRLIPGEVLKSENSQIFVSIEAAHEDLSLIHISEPTRRTPISYAVFCLKKKTDIDNYVIRSQSGVGIDVFHVPS